MVKTAIASDDGREQWRVLVGGSRGATERWPSRLYQSKSGARRRVRQIHDAHDIGVATIWMMRESDE